MARQGKSYISKEMRENVLKRDQYRCRYCGKTDVLLAIDHVYPESKGGPTILNNLVAACMSCNQAKRDHLGIWPYPIDYLEQLQGQLQELEQLRPYKERHDKIQKQKSTIIGTIKDILLIAIFIYLTVIFFIANSYDLLLIELARWIWIVLFIFVGFHQFRTRHIFPGVINEAE